MGAVGTVEWVGVFGVSGFARVHDWISGIYMTIFVCRYCM